MPIDHRAGAGLSATVPGTKAGTRNPYGVLRLKRIGSVLHQLVDCFPDEYEPLEKNYPVGKYGGVPFMCDFDTLLESISSPSEAVLHE